MICEACKKAADQQTTFDQAVSRVHRQPDGELIGFVFSPEAAMTGVVYSPDDFANVVRLELRSLQKSHERCVGGTHCMCQHKAALRSGEKIMARA